MQLDVVYHIRRKCEYLSSYLKISFICLHQAIPGTDENILALRIDRKTSHLLQIPQRYFISFNKLRIHPFIFLQNWNRIIQKFDQCFWIQPLLLNRSRWVSLIKSKYDLLSIQIKYRSYTTWSQTHEQFVLRTLSEKLYVLNLILKWNNSQLLPRLNVIIDHRFISKQQYNSFLVTQHIFDLACLVYLVDELVLTIEDEYLILFIGALDVQEVGEWASSGQRNDGIELDLLVEEEVVIFEAVGPEGKERALVILKVAVCCHEFEELWLVVIWAGRVCGWEIWNVRQELERLANAFVLKDSLIHDSQFVC